MLFTSYEFIFLFLPIVFIGFFGITASRLFNPNTRYTLAALWLAVASLFFYGWWNPQFVLLLLSSILFNYAMGYAIGHEKQKAAANTAKYIVTIAVAANLILLGYFKYSNFFIATLNTLSGQHLEFWDLLLPLGISFFTFTQIAFLIDVYRGIAREYNFSHYLLFVTYFPHLIAGPVLHHKQMMPQFRDQKTYTPSAENVAAGMFIFLLGLAKKVLLADSFAEYASPIFAAGENGVEPGFVAAWTGALSYTLQIYFDFSGYSDMAIGLSRLFGVKLPLNFNSPYQATSIIEFWRRWHMTLSQFLRDYLYIPLGGNRYGTWRRYLNLMLTMLLGGLWHGANWTFVAWGGLHGLFLAINHSWLAMQKKLEFPEPSAGLFSKVAGAGLTFLCVVIAWVFFRAQTFASALLMLSGMTKAPELFLASETPSFVNIFAAYAIPLDGFPYLLGLLALGLSIVWLAPNSQNLAERLCLKSNTHQYLAIGFCSFWVFLLAAINASKGVSEFIYFNF